MNKIRLTSLLLLFILVLASFPMIGFAADDDDRSFTIPKATFDLYVQENGNLRIKETLHYSFSGTYNGVYRDIPLKNGEKIENLDISTSGAYSDYQITNKTDMTSLKIFLYSDAQKTTPITNRDVVVTIEYDFINVIKIYNDIAELQFKVWGEEWEVDVGELTTNVHLKSQEGVKYWLNPPYYVLSDVWDDSVLKVVTKSISPGNYFEVRMAIPKDQFANPVFAKQLNENGMAIIEKIQQDYKDQINFYSILYMVLAVIMLLSIVIPIIIYFKYGREPKTTYRGEYERELPTKDSPAVVNAISGKGFGKSVGNPNMDGFQATIMDLINRGFLGVYTEKKGRKKQVNLEIKQKSFEELYSFEKHVITFLRRFAVDNIINMDYLKKELKKQDKAKSFKSSYDAWEGDLNNLFLNKKTDKFFIKTGDTYIKTYGVLAIILAGIVFFFTVFNPLPASIYAFLASIVLGVAGIISIILPEKVGGRWTQEGIDYDAKWQAFKKYIQDFSLIKEYPPESVAVWNKYLVYATALGVADKVRKSMEISLPDDQLDRSDLYLFHYYGGYALLSSSLSTGMTTVNQGDGGSGGVGGVGGGSGGGGGGAF
ncbi:DUF2207 domain-containing protein [Methanobacterium alcaliphilum]|uniref:DUF2207 domain-containing protein n=1 Tax=Methanobacterium alcaliphilum TaxID=392018 RepID=UPI00200B9AFF|nr:DUF2207 domain-containing protein [Methanobacterium alcaliphilum]MCK9152119.1 DUF2207 domain-containing protein [Methanobacterium alcaliphilum]